MRPLTWFTLCVSLGLLGLALGTSSGYAASAYARASSNGGTFSDEGGNRAEAESAGSLGAAGALVELDSGTLRCHALTSRRWQTAEGLTLAFDAFTLLGLPFGTEVDIPVELRVTGSMDADISLFGEESFALVWADLHHSESAEWGGEKLLVFTLQSFDSDPVGVRIDQVITRTYRMTAGVPFGISYELITKTGGIGAADFTGTGVLSFKLPAGTSVSSVAGFHQEAEPGGEAPTLAIQRAGDSVIISWSPPTPGFELEETVNLAGTDWASAPDGNPVTIQIAGMARYYRLKKP